MDDEPAIIVVGPCYTCKRLFGFNPLWVPSYDPSKDDPSKPAGRVQVCPDCFADYNRRRVAEGLEPVPLHPDAYEPASPAVLDYGGD